MDAGKTTVLITEEKTTFLSSIELCVTSFPYDVILYRVRLKWTCNLCNNILARIWVHQGKYKFSDLSFEAYVGIYKKNEEIEFLTSWTSDWFVVSGSASLGYSSYGKLLLFYNVLQRLAYQIVCVL